MRRLLIASLLLTGCGELPYPAPKTATKAEQLDTLAAKYDARVQPGDEVDKSTGFRKQDVAEWEAEAEKVAPLPQVSTPGSDLDVYRLGDVRKLLDRSARNCVEQVDVQEAR